MEIIEIEVQADWTADEDLEEFEARFGAHDNVQAHGIERIEAAYDELQRALSKALHYYLNQTSAPLRIAVEALSVPEKCRYISDCVARSGRPSEYAERFKDHLDAVLHYDRQRELVMARHWANPDHAWLIELADVADTISTSCFEFDEGMCCEHEDYESAIDTDPPEQ